MSPNFGFFGSFHGSGLLFLVFFGFTMVLGYFCCFSLVFQWFSLVFYTRIYGSFGFLSDISSWCLVLIGYARKKRTEKGEADPSQNGLRKAMKTFRFDISYFVLEHF